MSLSRGSKPILTEQDADQASKITRNSSYSAASKPFRDSTWYRSREIPNPVPRKMTSVPCLGCETGVQSFSSTDCEVQTLGRGIKRKFKPLFRGGPSGSVPERSQNRFRTSSFLGFVSVRFESLRARHPARIGVSVRAAGIAA